MLYALLLMRNSWYGSIMHFNSDDKVTANFRNVQIKSFVIPFRNIPKPLIMPYFLV